MKTCRDCGATKPIEQFNRDRKAKDGRCNMCKPCSVERVKAWQRANPERRAEQNRKGRAKLLERDPDYWRNHHFQRMYGITLADYEALYEQQGGACRICGSLRDVLDVDHCHGSGQIRGLLCGPCNKALGQMNDDPARLRAAAEYLEAHVKV